MISGETKARGVPRLAIVLPSFNEGESIQHAAHRLMAVFRGLIDDGLIAEDSFLFFVDDGSTDQSWQIIEKLNRDDRKIRGLKLSRNFGHQAALLAGLSAVAMDCDASISIDTDLQQDPEAIRSFVAEFHRGSDVVLGVRKDRGSDGWFKRKTAIGFYQTMKALGVNIVPNHADYRLLSKRALDALLQFPEPTIFLRAICLQIGFRVSSIFFEVRERQFGRTKYSLKKMLSLAVHGITSFSIVPLRVVAFIGLFLFLASLAMAGYVAWRAIIIGDTVPGWASTALPIYFIGGVQLLCLGIVSEYVGQIYSTVKNRPRWICEHKLD